MPNAGAARSELRRRHDMHSGMGFVFIAEKRSGEAVAASPREKRDWAAAPGKGIGRNGVGDFCVCSGNGARFPLE